MSDMPHLFMKPHYLIDQIVKLASPWPYLHQRLYPLTLCHVCLILFFVLFEHCYTYVICPFYPKSYISVNGTMFSAWTCMYLLLLWEIDEIEI